MKLLLLLLAATIGTADDHKSKQHNQAASEEITTVVGVVDQNGSDYVIGEGKRLEGKMYMRAHGFSPDNFARYVGRRVQVQGKISTESGRKVLTVTNLDSFKVLKIEDEQ